MLERGYDEFAKNGLKLRDLTERRRLAKIIKRRIDSLSAEFAAILARAKRRGWVPSHAPEELPGLPDGRISQYEIRHRHSRRAKIFANFSEHERLVHAQCH